MDNPGRHDTNHVTGLISKSIDSLRSCREGCVRVAVDRKECDNALKRDIRVLWLVS